MSGRVPVVNSLIVSTRTLVPVATRVSRLAGKAVTQGVCDGPVDRRVVHVRRGLGPVRVGEESADGEVPRQTSSRTSMGR
jgi:hypothetical protein